MDKNEHYLITDTVVFSRVCDVPVLAVTRDQFEETDVAACVLNEAGEFIWHEIEMNRSCGEIIAHTAEHFQESAESVQEEVVQFLDRLEQKKLIQRVK